MFISKSKKGTHFCEMVLIHLTWSSQKELASSRHCVYSHPLRKTFTLKQMFKISRMNKAPAKLFPFQLGRHLFSIRVRGYSVPEGHIQQVACHTSLFWRTPNITLQKLLIFNLWEVLSAGNAHILKHEKGWQKHPPPLFNERVTRDNQQEKQP